MHNFISTGLVITLMSMYVCTCTNDFAHTHYVDYCHGIAKVSKGAKIRNGYNQVPHLTQDTFLKAHAAPFRPLFTGFMITLLSMYVHAHMTAHTHYVDYCHVIVYAHRCIIPASLYRVHHNIALCVCTCTNDCAHSSC